MIEEKKKKKKNWMYKGSSQWLQSYSKFSILFYAIKSTVLIHHPTTSKQSVLTKFVSVVVLGLL